jgi:AAA domain
LARRRIGSTRPNPADADAEIDGTANALRQLPQDSPAMSAATVAGQAGISGDFVVRPAPKDNGHADDTEGMWTDRAIAFWGKLTDPSRAAFRSSLWTAPDAQQSERVLDIVRFAHAKGLALADLLSMATWDDGFGMPKYREFHLKCAREQWAVLERVAQPYPGLAEALSASNWLQRSDPPPDRLLGDLITTTIRVFLVGLTGLGKTMLGLAIGIAMALGQAFCHWRSHRPARVLYIDGEMPVELIIQRTRDAARRAGKGDTIPNLMIYSVEDADKWAERWPELGKIEPLNTEAGHEFIYRLCDATKPDVVIFDNVQSLVLGVQKEEETWAGVNPLLQGLTKRRIGQVYLDHANQSGRQYGTITKGWRADAVGIMSPLDEAPDPDETGFVLTFDPAQGGKCRRRSPDNWQDFAPHIFRLRGDEWSSEAAAEIHRRADDRRFGKLGDDAKSLFRIAETLLAAVRGEQVVPEPDYSPVAAVSRSLLRAAAIDAGWFPESDLASSGDSKLATSGRGYDRENKAFKRLKEKGLIGFTRDWVWLL